MRSALTLVLCQVLFLVVQLGCARLPAIDPTGNRIFLPRPYATSIAGSNASAGLINPLRSQQPSTTMAAPNSAAPVVSGQLPVGPAFQNPPDPPPCDQPFVNDCRKKHIIPHPKQPTSNAARGQIITTPHRIVAPVGSEVVVLAGICGPDARFVMNQPLEWMLSNDSVGQFIEVGGMEHNAFNQLVAPTAKKIDGQYAWGRTGIKNKLLTRGTPTPIDDITLLKGQTYISLASASPGTSYVTSVAPKAAGWDKRRATTLVHWVDGNWAIPVPTLATAGTVHAMTTRVTSATGDGGVSDWKVRYTIVGGAPAEFAPTGSQSVEAITGVDGLATVQIRQPAGQFDPGTTQVRVDVVRPKQYGEPELVVESGITTVTWSAPQLTIRVISPGPVNVGQPFNYRIEVSNPGDQIARAVKVSTRDLNQDVEFISSAPKPTEYGNTLEWQLGDIAPGASPQIIDVQLKSTNPGMAELCFEVASDPDGLRTQACAQTEIVAICIGLDIEGPTEAQVGQEVDFNLVISNQCDEPLDNLELTVNYDPGLSAIDLTANPIRYKIDSLGFGKREEVPLSFRVLEEGRKCFELSITADGGNSAQSRTCITVTAGDGGGAELNQRPPIGLELTGQQRIEMGGSTLVRAVLRNNTGQPINDVVLTNRFSPSLNPIKVTEDYSQGWLGNDLVFNVGTLAPGQEALVEIEYDALQADASAFSQMTVTSPRETDSNIQRIEILIVPAGSTPNEPGIGIPAEGGRGGQFPPGSQPQTEPPGIRPAQEPTQPPANPGDRIGIPPDSSQGALQIEVRALEPIVNVGDTARVRLTVRNTRNTTDEAIDITVLIPPSLRLVDYDDSQWGLALQQPNEDFTTFSFERRNEMRPGDEISFIAFVKAIQSGIATVEVQAKSLRTVGVATGSGTLSVR